MKPILTCILFLSSIFLELPALAEDGKVFVQSEPAGATILLLENGEKKDLSKKSPTLLSLPLGKQTLSLELVGYIPANLEVEIDGKTILKPTVVKLERQTVLLDVVYEPDWLVFIDGLPSKDAEGKQAKTPCSINGPLGNHDLALAKEGFIDIKQRIEVKEKATVEIKNKANKGASVLLAAVPRTEAWKFDPAQWFVVAIPPNTGNWREYGLSELKNFTAKATDKGGLIENNEEFQDMTFLYKELIKGDFECKMILVGNSAAWVKLSDKQNNCVHADLTPGDNELLIKRDNHDLKIKLNGREVTITKWQKSSLTMPGYIGLGMRKGHTATIKSFTLQQQ
jgi:hypothetical protein